MLTENLTQVLLQSQVFNDVINNTLLVSSFIVNIALAGLTILATVYLAREIEDTRAKAIAMVTLMISVVSISSYTGLLSGLTLSYTVMPSGHALAGQEVLTMWGRYLTWALSTPFILIALGMLAGSDWVKIGTTVVFTIAMNVTGLAAALTSSSIVLRWSWFVLSSVFFLVIVYAILFEWSEEADSTGTGDIFSTLKILTVVTWFGYPILWFVGVEGVALLDVGVTSWGYSLLDILAKYIVTLLIVKYVADEPESVTGGGEDYAST